VDDHLESRIEGTIHADELIVGKGVVVEAGAVIAARDGAARRVELGDFCYVGRETRVLVPEFVLGDYSKLHAYSFAHGGRPLRIGRNCWIGGNTVLDSIAGLDIADNVGIGAHSQIWTHMRFGDVVEGCRFDSERYMHVGEDAWFVGHCIVSPVRVERRSMALVGSVVTRDMLENRVYGGVPAADLTDRMGPQFEARTIEQKAATLGRILDDFLRVHPEHRGRLAIAGDDATPGDGVTWFDLRDRTYTRTRSAAEVAFLKAHTPRIKFVPRGVPSPVPPAPPV
jgi:acetyltransferase-like isoleucine patch superfamily enzyme